MKALLACLAGILVLGACRVPLGDFFHEAPPAPEEVSEAPPHVVAALGDGAAPGSARGPGGFVPRGHAKSFYAGARGRLWYYMNNYYWVSDTAPREDLWIKAEVVEEFRDLRKWPDGDAVAGPDPKVTVEYWEVGPTGRSVRLDNHKDYLLLSDHYTAGAITVQVTLTLGRLQVKDEKDRWAPPEEAYVLEYRNYRRDRGIGEDRARFTALATEAVTVWGYRVPWSTHPQRLTRSNWKRLRLPTWSLIEKRPPPRVPASARVVTPRDTQATER